MKKWRMSHAKVAGCYTRRLCKIIQGAQVKSRVCGSRIMKIEQDLTKQQHHDSHESGADESVNNNNIIIRL